MASDPTQTTGRDQVSWAYGWAAGRRGTKLTKPQIPAWIDADEYERGRRDGEKEDPFIESAAMPDDSQTTMKLGSISAYLLRYARAHFVTERPTQKGKSDV